MKHFFLRSLLIIISGNGVWLYVSCVEREPIILPSKDVPKDEGDKVPVDKEDLSKNPALHGYAFDKLTATGKTVFVAARNYIETQKSSAYHTFAQPLQCAINVSEVLEMADMPPPAHAHFSVPGLLTFIKNGGGTLHELPAAASSQTEALMDYLNTHFSGKLPTGILVAGCTVAGCETKESSEAHVALLGDKDHNGALMLYHNNWLRPNNTRGVRKPYMVSISAFYDLQRPREWMATPWLKLTHNDEGMITDITSLSPDIDDLDPLNGKYVITLAIPRAIQEEIDNKAFLKHHRLMVRDNVHKRLLESHPDHKRVVCRSHGGLKDMEVRLGEKKTPSHDIQNTLKRYSQYRTPYHSSFEFLILEKQLPWLAVTFYAANRYFGSAQNKVWLKDADATCKTMEAWLDL